MAKVEPKACCRRPMIRLESSRDRFDRVCGYFLTCFSCMHTSPPVSVGTIGKSDRWNVAARAWNRDLEKKGR
jgi:hypothetical protein